MSDIGWFGWVGLIIGAIGIAVAIYFGLSSRRRRELSFSVNPVRTKIVTSGQATDLRVLFHDEPLGDVDIAAVQLAIWNAGNESIKPEHIRKEIIITTTPQVRILEASVRTASPDTGFNLLDSADSNTKGRVPTSWKILERNDGASIQLLYLGTPEVDISVEGLIEGQGQAKRIVTSSSFKSPEAHQKARRKLIFGVAALLLSLLVTALMKFVFQVQGPSDIVTFLYTMSILFLIALILGLISNLREKFPPFRF